MIRLLLKPVFQSPSLSRALWSERTPAANQKKPAKDTRVAGCSHGPASPVCARVPITDAGRLALAGGP
jgi:hypothetical protein